MTLKEIKAAVKKLKLRDGDIILVDFRAVDIRTMVQAQATAGGKHVVLFIYPEPGMTLAECLRTCRKEDLSKALEYMRKENHA